MGRFHAYVATIGKPEVWQVLKALTPFRDVSDEDKADFDFRTHKWSIYEVGGSYPVADIFEHAAPYTMLTLDGSWIENNHEECRAKIQCYKALREDLWLTRAECRSA